MTSRRLWPTNSGEHTNFAPLVAGFIHSAWHGCPYLPFCGAMVERELSGISKHSNILKHPLFRVNERLFNIRFCWRPLWSSDLLVDAPCRFTQTDSTTLCLTTSHPYQSPKAALLKTVRFFFAGTDELQITRYYKLYKFCDATSCNLTHLVAGWVTSCCWPTWHLLTHLRWSTAPLWASFGSSSAGRDLGVGTLGAKAAAKTQAEGPGNHWIYNMAHAWVYIFVSLLSPLHENLKRNKRNH